VKMRVRETPPGGGAGGGYTLSLAYLPGAVVDGRSQQPTCKTAEHTACHLI
jgi:hypothetical protein